MEMPDLNELCKIRPIFNAKNSDFPYRFPKPLNILMGIDSRKQNRHVIFSVRYTLPWVL